MLRSIPFLRQSRVLSASACRALHSSRALFASQEKLEEIYVESEKDIESLLQNNRSWAEATIRADPDFFKRLENQQTPNYLWIGCSDSRVPANQIVGLNPGEVFVHRNVANLVDHADLNCLSALQYSVEVLKVKHVIVCGHYNCGGVRAALENADVGLVQYWIHPIREVAAKYADILNKIDDVGDRTNKLVELNVMQQVTNVCATRIVQTAWERGQPLSVHGWVYSLKDGRLRNVGVRVTGQGKKFKLRT